MHTVCLKLNPIGRIICADSDARGFTNITITEVQNEYYFYSLSKIDERLLYRSFKNNI